MSGHAETYPRWADGAGVPCACGASAARLKVRLVGEQHQADRRDGRGWVDVTREEFDAIVGPAELCPFCDDDDKAEDCAW